MNTVLRPRRRPPLPSLSLLVLVLRCLSGSAAQIVCEGVLGNSGEQGSAVVRFGDVSRARGMGAVLDRFGSAWDRAGEGVLNRYAVDGRLLGQYGLPEGAADSDQLALAGDILVVLVGGQLLTLPVTAEPGTAARPVGVKAERLSFAAVNGRVAASQGRRVFLIDPTTGQAQDVAEFEEIQAVELGPDGSVYVQSRRLVHKLGADGQPVTGDGWPRPSPGDRMQLLDGHWYGHAWHGTIRRFTADLEAAPGVVLGGASGSVIGHLDQNSELFYGRGLARLRSDLFAVSGLGGVLHLVAWDGNRQQMEIVRRIGSVPGCRSLAVDGQGNVWWFAGAWHWTDAPDTPLRCGVNPPEYPWGGQAVVLENDHVIVPCHLWGKPTFYHGLLASELAGQRLETGCALARDVTGATVCRQDGRRVLLTVTRTGQGQAFVLGEDGSYQAEAGPFELKPLQPLATGCTSLAMKDADTLLAAADGQVLELTRDGSDWRETRRWRREFGATIHLAAAAGRLWVADRDRHRVLVLDLTDGALLAEFATCDQTGTDLASLSAPETIAARGDRAVVFDSGNQRLLKLVLK